MSVEAGRTLGVEVTDIRKSYPAPKAKGAPVVALDGVSLSARPGEIFGLLGPNGAGKSTLIRILATLTRADSGRAVVAGHDVATEGAQVRRRVGVALQDTGVEPSQTGRGLLTLHARLYGYSRRQAAQRVDELIERCALAEVIDRRIAACSGGWRRRIDLALALVNRPTVLFLDEPTTGLDPASRHQLWQEVRELRAEGTTILLTTQYLEEADALADRIAIIEGGHVVNEGSPAELKRKLRRDVIELELSSPEGARLAGDVLDVQVSDGATSVRVSVDDASVEVAKVVTSLAQHDIRPVAVKLTSPTLDDVFLNVVNGQGVRQ
jgi:ABC-2 type transport system ATP-binding protein